VDQVAAELITSRGPQRVFFRRGVSTIRPWRLPQVAE
jgi:hypothetical protein